MDIVEDVVSELDDCAALGAPGAAALLSLALQQLSDAALSRARAIQLRLEGNIAAAAAHEAKSEASIQLAKDAMASAGAAHEGGAKATLHCRAGKLWP